MSITLQPGQTLQAIASAASAITVTVLGTVEHAGVLSLQKQLYQGQVPATATTLVTAKAGEPNYIDEIHVANTTGTARTIQFFHNGSAAANALIPAISIDAGGFATYTERGWQFYNSSGTLKSAGATGAAGAAVKPFRTFLPTDNQPPASAYATPDYRNTHPILDFDGTTDEEAVFKSVLPTTYDGGGLTVDTYWSFTSATSGSLRVQAAIERIDVSSLDIDADSFAAFQSAGGTAPGTSGMVVKATVTFTAGAQMDSLAAGEMFRLKIRRDADGTSGTDDITTDAELHAVAVRET